MIQTPLLTFPLWESILLASAVITALTVIWTKVVKPTVFGVRTFFKKFTAIEKLAQELIPNGGTSLRDAIDRIETTVTFLNERQKALIQDIPYGIIEYDATGKLVWANRTYLRRLDISLEQVLGNGWINLVHSDDVDRVVKTWVRTVEAGVDYHATFRFTAVGIDVPVNTKSYSLHDRHGELVGYIAVVDFDVEKTINYTDP